MKSFAFVLVSFLLMANVGIAFGAETEPCCEIIEIQENGIVKVKELETGRTFNVQIDDKAQLEGLRVGQPLYVNFATGAVGLHQLQSSSSGASEYGEAFFDIYAGSTVTQRADIRLASPIGTAFASNASFDSSVVAGIRGGAWLKSVPYLGFAVDFFYFTTNVSPQTATGCIGTLCGSAFSPFKIEARHYAIALDTMLRFPIAKSAEFPNGRFQPYITAGPALFISSVNVAGFGSTSTTLGFKGGAGGKFFFTENIALFGEYRLTWFEPDQNFFVGNTQIIGSTSLTTHHFIGGFSYHFN